MNKNKIFKITLAIMFIATFLISFFFIDNQFKKYPVKINDEAVLKIDKNK